MQHFMHKDYFISQASSTSFHKDFSRIHKYIRTYIHIYVFHSVCSVYLLIRLKNAGRRRLKIYLLNEILPEKRVFSGGCQRYSRLLATGPSAEKHNRIGNLLKTFREGAGGKILMDIGMY